MEPVPVFEGVKNLKLVYICSPLQGDIQGNIKKAIGYCAYAANKGVLPLAPHTIFTQYLDDTIPEQRERGLTMGIELLKRCDELWVCGNIISKGMKNEIAFAQRNGICTQYITGKTISEAKDDPPCIKKSLAGRISAAKPVTAKAKNHTTNFILER